MKFIKIAILFIGISSFAQGKVGAVDVEFIVANMPEMVEVQDKLQAYAGQLDVDFNTKIDEYNALVEAYQSSEASLTIAQKKEKQQEIIDFELDIQKFQQNGAKLLELKEQEYLKPLYQRVGEALDKVAKANNFTQVSQITAHVLYLDPAYDLTPAVLEELGISITED